MRKVFVVCFGLLLLSGCCTDLKNKVSAYGVVIEEQMQVSKLLLTKCQNGDAPSCTEVGKVLTAIEASAKTLQQ